MKYFSKILFLLSILLFLGCGKDTTPKPAPLADFKPTLNVEKSWSHSIGSNIGPDNLKLDPAFYGNQVFVPDYKGKITALDKTTGKSLWKTNTKTTITSSLAANGSLVFAGAGSGQLLALDKNNGESKWAANLANEDLATPLATNNIVATKTTDGQLTVFNAATGSLLWKYMQEQPPLVLRGGSAPKAQDGLLISGFANGEIVAFNEDTGKISWRQLVAEPSGTFAVERMVDIVADPVIVDNTIYVATYQGKIAALNLHNGRILWTKDASTFSGLAVTNNMVIISDANDYVTAFDRATGAQLWQQKSLEYRGLTAPATISHYAVVGDAEGYLHFIDTRNGRFAARVAVGGGGIVAAPIVNDNAVYVVTRSGYLAKFVL